MKALNEDELDVLTRLAAATPDDVELIISGGWAARLHRLHPWSTDVTFAPLLTKDLDVAVREGTASGAALLSGLRAQGFKDAPRGDEKPPIESYLLEDRPEFELEFITDLQGGSSDRHGNSRRTVAISGVTAQRTRHVGVLLEAPWALQLGETKLHVASPGQYLVQKLLSLPDRKHDAKQAKDAVYVHDSLLLFQQGQQLHPHFVSAVQHAVSQLTKPQVARLKQTRAQLESPTSTVVKNAAAQLTAVGRQTDPSAFALLCRLGFAELGLP